MSDGLSRVAGSPTAVFIHDETEYTLCASTLGMLAELESYLASRSPNPLVEAMRSLSGVSDKHHATVIDAGMRAAKNVNRALAPRVASFSHTREGLAFLFWQHTRERHGLTLADALRMVVSLEDADITILAAKITTLQSTDLACLRWMEARRPLTGESTLIPWAKIFIGLSEKYGWTPDQISKLTLYQASVYLGALCPELGAVTLTTEQRAAYGF
jgi:hypothetical protein